MKNFKKLITICLSTFVFSATVAANDVTIETVEIQTEIADSVQLAVAEISVPAVENAAKLQLEEMTFKQNVEQFLALARFNEETQSISTQIIAE
ncbi:hypothetical protein [Planctobacterium marinum]|uniref:hypothetical protein n=1 Tax=Planctobacterium marinum TaxID=1631968 RepID=UPI001E6048FC|nr:hypothetical protein [Planctobacterium marinum]MCC2603901.1 hypothetical protein [Planctobacterium marinum]